MKLKKEIKQFILYLFVGGCATLVEWITFFLLDRGTSLHYMLATSIAFIFSTFANWLVGRLVMFHETKSLVKELVQIYLTSIAGLLMNLLIMWVTIHFHLIKDEMIAKMLATGIVFFWNFLVRKLVIYKE